MEKMTLHLGAIDCDVNRVTSGNTIGGILFITIGSTYFPEENWYDMVSVDFENWIPRLISFAQNHTDSCVLDFMDGPGKVKILRLTDGIVTAACIWDHKTQIQEVEIDFYEFLDSISTCVRKFNRILYENNLPGQHMKELVLIKNIMS